MPVKKIAINQNVEKNIFLVIASAIVLSLTFAITDILVRRVNAQILAESEKNYTQIVEGYAQAVRFKLDTYIAGLQRFYIPDFVEENSNLQIQSFLRSHTEQNHPDFHEVFYVDRAGLYFFQNGEIRNFHTMKKYVSDIFEGKTDLFISDICVTSTKSEDVIIISRPVYDADDIITGVLGASIKTSHLTDIFRDVKFDKKGNMFVLDSTGKFITHRDGRYLNNVFEPDGYITSSQVAAQKKGIVDTLSVEGIPIKLFFEGIENTDWVLGFLIPQSYFRQLEKTQRKYQILTIVIVMIVLALICLSEACLTSFFEKRQMLSTHIDSLTHLWTREYFEKEAEKLFRRYPHSKFVLTETDIVGFKFLNQKVGSSKANKLLVYFSKLLNKMKNQNRSIICRGYSDHFYTFSRITTVRTAMRGMKEGIDAISERIKKYDVPFTPKFGIAFYIPKSKNEKPSIQALINQATMANSTIKKDALSNFAIYDSKLLKQSADNQRIEENMYSALANNEFFVMYQPKIDLRTDKIVGAEALVRWQSSTMGFMPPNSFIPLFEKNNFIIKLDFYVYEQVFKFLRKCLDNGSPVVPISVNMSRNHDKPEKFIHEFTSLIKKYNIPPHLVEIELLERSSIDQNLLREMTLMLHNEGYVVAMDDFGSGESSLNMLLNIPIDVLKFDRSFLLDSNRIPGYISESTADFIKSLVELGKNLKKKTIFEGVETKYQRDFLRSIQCDQVQGFFYSKALKEAEFLDFIQNNS